MLISKIPDHIRVCIDSGQSVELLGSSGCGKSEVVKSLPERWGTEEEPWGMSTCFLATQDPGTMYGIQFKSSRIIEGMNDGQPTTVSDPALPQWMLADGTNRPLNSYPRGILHLEEFGQGGAETKRIAAELFLNRQLGPWQLHDGIAVIATSNQAKHNSGVTKSFDFLINRRSEIIVDTDLESWLAWAASKKVSPEFMAYAKQYPGHVFSGEHPKEQGPWCTPRSLVACDGIYQQMKKQGLDPESPDATELMAGTVGMASTQTLQTFLKLRRTAPSIQDICKAPSKAPVPEAPDAAYLTIFMLAHHAAEDNLDKLVTYVSRMQGEFATTFLYTVCKKNSALILHDSVQGWVRQNHALMAACAA